jgi:hypothetical protein
MRARGAVIRGGLARIPLALHAGYEEPLFSFKNSHNHAAHADVGAALDLVEKHKPQTQTPARFPGRKSDLHY